MTSPLRLLVQRAAGRWLRERAIPVGGVAADRRLLCDALPQDSLGRVLVVGASLAARQAWPQTVVDVVGTSPYASDVTVCSHLDGPDSLPPARWDTVLVTETDPRLAERLQVLRSACRPRARLVVLQRVAVGDPAAALAQVGVVQEVHHRRHRRLVVAEVSP
jgi:hypothetical protein